MKQRAWPRVLGATATIVLLSVPVTLRSVSRQGRDSLARPSASTRIDNQLSCGRLGPPGCATLAVGGTARFEGLKTIRPETVVHVSIVTQSCRVDPFPTSCASTPEWRDLSGRRPYQETHLTRPTGDLGQSETGRGSAQPQDQPEHATSRSYNRALGVECSHCHSMEKFADESKPTFDFARRMERMVHGLSDGPLQDLGGVTCWGCHRGHAIPSRLPREKWEPIAKRMPPTSPVGGRAWISRWECILRRSAWNARTVTSMGTGPMARGALIRWSAAWRGCSF